MRSRLVILMAVVIAAAAVIFAVSRLGSFLSIPDPPASLPPNPASYLGVYETGIAATYQPVADFTKAAGRQPNLVGYYSGWGEPFETSFAETVRSHGAVTILQMDPTSPQSRRSPPVATTATCARLPTASGTSATRSSSASGTR